MTTITPQPATVQPDAIEFLLRRRSCKIKTLAAPGPDDQQLAIILQIAARVPDHGKLAPWSFVTFTGDARADFGKILAQAWKQDNPDAEPAKLDLESERFLRAPVVVAVLSHVREGKIPAWEQILSAGAACQNLILAATMMGFGAQWVTEWYATNNTVRTALGLKTDQDQVAGFIYLGTPSEIPEERPRPEMDAVVTQWTGVKS